MWILILITFKKTVTLTCLSDSSVRFLCLSFLLCISPCWGWEWLLAEAKGQCQMLTEEQMDKLSNIKTHLKL